MNITRVETICLSRPHEIERQWITARYRTMKADCAIVRIETDEGLTGLGEACAYGHPLLIRDWVRWMTPELIGTDPTDPSIVPRPTGGSRSHDTAVAGIDAALWDLRGKIEARSVSQLLTGSPLDRVRLYASAGCCYDWRVGTEPLLREARACAEAGYTAMKVRLGTDWSWDGVTADRFIALARELSSEVGGRMELMVDGNCRLTYDESLLIARELERLGYVWFEEPLPKDDIEGYVKLNAAVGIPITGGESLTTLEQFRPFLERKAYAIVQQDAGVCGITEAMRIARAAERFGIPTCPHNWHNGAMLMANAHLVAALPRPKVLEQCLIQGPLQWGILEKRPQIVDGHLVLPDAPGLGFALADGIEEKFPYIEGDYFVQVRR